MDMIHRDAGSDSVDFGKPLVHVRTTRAAGTSREGGIPDGRIVTETSVEHVGVLPDVVDYRHVLRLRPEGTEKGLVLADDRGRLAGSGREFVANA